MSTTTLSDNINNLITPFNDYLGVLIAKLWPFALGLAVIFAVWYLGRKAIHSFR